MVHIADSHDVGGRLVPVFASNEDLDATALTLGLAKTAAARGETVLMVDCQGGSLMQAAGIIYNITMEDVLFGGASIQDAQYVTSNEHFSAMAAGGAGLGPVLGSLAALSLHYDWVFVGAQAGCTPSHVRLAGAADVSVLAYNTQADKFMRAYWMMEAVRRRYPRFDPFTLAMGNPEGAVETALLLRDTIADFLGAPPPFAGHIDDANLLERLTNSLRAQGEEPLAA